MNKIKEIRAIRESISKYVFAENQEQLITIEYEIIPAEQYQYRNVAKKTSNKVTDYFKHNEPSFIVKDVAEVLTAVGLVATLVGVLVLGVVKISKVTPKQKQEITIETDKGNIITFKVIKDESGKLSELNIGDSLKFKVVK